MMSKQYCPYCMKPVAPGAVCQGCGKRPESYRSEAHHYPAGQLLAGRYLVGRALGEGGFGITYLGFDTKLERRVAIKEYFPRSLVRRDTATTLNVTCYTGSDPHFEKGREQFLREAQVLAKLDAYPEIVHVLDYFAENNSAYIVMEFLEGITLKDMVVQGGVMSAKELLDMLRPIIKSLDAIHAEGLIHRDISPDNLMILDKNKQVKLMDFGCARELGMGHTMTVMLKPGFAPAEQYTGREQGAWSDVYSLCATIYYCLTGKIPMEAMARMGSDRLIPPSELGMGIDPDQEKALLRGLALDSDNRWRSAADLYAALYGETVTGIPVVIAGDVISDQSEIPEKELSETIPAPEQTSATEYSEKPPVVFPPVPEIPVVEAPEIPAETEYVKPEEDTAAEEVAATEFVKAEDPGATEFVAVDTPGETEFVKPDEPGRTEFVKPDQPEDEEEKPVVIPFWKRFMLLPKKKKAAICGGALLLLLLLGFGAFWLFHPHRYGDWTVSVAAGCTKDGTEIRSCFCGAEESRTVTATGHVTATDAAITSTCTEAGKTEGKHCSVCQTVLVPQKDLPLAEHQVVETPEIPATCSQEGSTAGQVCSVCNTTIAGVFVIPKLPHTPVDIQTVAATCSQEGKTGGKECSVCKEILEEPVISEKLPHTPVTGRTIAATCTEEGRSGGTECAVCQEILEEPTTIAKLPHKEVTDKAVAATCTQEGKTEGSHCSVCNTVIRKQQTIAKTSHKEVIDKAVAATCAKPGKTEGSHCSVCNTVIRAQTEVTKPHTWQGNVCTVCGAENIRVTLSTDKGDYVTGETITVTAKIKILDTSAGNKVDYSYHWGGAAGGVDGEGSWKNCYDGQTVTLQIPNGLQNNGTLYFSAYYNMEGPNRLLLDSVYPEVVMAHVHTWKGNVCTECLYSNVIASITLDKSSYNAGDTAKITIAVTVKDPAAAKPITVSIINSNLDLEQFTITPTTNKNYVYSRSVGTAYGFLDISVDYDFLGSYEECLDVTTVEVNVP